VHEKLMDFRHENHGQVRDAVRVVAHPSFRFFIFDESDDLPSQLEQEWLPRRDVNHSELDAANVGAGHCDLFHVINSTDSFNERRNLGPILLDDAPIDFITFLIHLVRCFEDHLPITLRGIMEWIDGSRLVHRTGLEV